MKASARKTGAPPPLLFEWRRERGVKRRLAMWLLVVAAGHAALFYLFRVAPPLASRKPPPQNAVLYLPPAGPEVRALLSVLEDRYPGSLRRSEDYHLRRDLEALAKVTPPSEPSWATHRPALKPFTEPLVSQELPPLVLAGEPVLPEVSPVPPPLPAVVKSAPVPSLIVDQPPGGRSVVRQPAWPEKFIDESWGSGGSVPFMLGVTRNGDPAYCLPLSPATDIDLEALRKLLMGMKFSPLLSGGLEWINVQVRW